MCIFFHKWNKWTQYTIESIKDKNGVRYIVSVEKRQKRHCETCNKEQDEFISLTY